VCGPSRFSTSKLLFSGFSKREKEKRGISDRKRKTTTTTIRQKESQLTGQQRRQQVHAKLEQYGRVALQSPSLSLSLSLPPPLTLFVLSIAPILFGALGRM